MYALEIRDHVMIAHRLPDPVFGPAQGLHGATFVVDVAFFRAGIEPYNFVVDIGRAGETLKLILGEINYANLDELFPGQLTTTEFLCRMIFDRLAAAARTGALGPGGEDLARIRVTLHESHVARAWYEASLDG